MCVEVQIDMRKYFQSTLMLKVISYHHITVHQGQVVYDNCIEIPNTLLHEAYITIKLV